MRKITCFLVLALSVAVPSRGAGSTDRFSGTWKMDPARSESAHQDVSLGVSTLVIQLTGNELTIETTRRPAENSPPFHEILNFRLDNSETTNSGNAGVSVTGKAHMDGAKLVTETMRNVQNSTVTTLYVHTLSANGREMTIDKTLTVQHGYQGMS
ncbi:MAG TPA: hypothetical protein VG345_02690, partial [Bryobacteraceae bacterium]|nr:hypothetical protein [Bryobacteraceae bacterium]